MQNSHLKSQQTDIMIIGGSLVGLSASLFLSWRGIKNILIEKHLNSSPHPRAMGYTEHTLEFFRITGIGDEIPQVNDSFRLRRIRAESLSGKWFEESPWTPQTTKEIPMQYSPVKGAAIAQDKLEPILRKRALALGADFRLGSEMIDFTQNSQGVSARIRHRETLEEQIIEAKYMIAADGCHSSVRSQLGIQRNGVGYLQTVYSVLFSCPEADLYLKQGIQQFEIEQPHLKAFLTTYHDGRWVLMFTDHHERTEDELKAAIHLALGKKMDFKIITTGQWEMAGWIAEHYRDGRIFLAGDAAHQLPPTRGGFGANTGIDDVYNLAWKLELVIKGNSAPILLSTYQTERQPIAVLRHDQTFARPDYHKFLGAKFNEIPLFSDLAMELGQRLCSSAIVDTHTNLPPAATPTEWAGQPGTRAPHAWIHDQQNRRSTIDLFGQGFILLTQNPRWKIAAHIVAEKTAIPLRTFVIGVDVFFDQPDEFNSLFGINAEGVSLVRPDGFIAWRSINRPDDPENVLLQVINQIAVPIKNSIN